MTLPGLIAVLTLAVPLQERHSLKVTAKSGDRFTHHQEQTNEVALTTSLGNNRSTQEILNREVLTYDEEIVAAENGEPTQVRRTFLQWWREAGPKGEKPHKQAFMLQGKTIVLRRKGNETAYEGAEGIPLSELSRNRIRQEPFLNSLPREAVAVGHEWAVDEERFRREIQATASGGPMKFETVKAKGKFARVETRRGEKCAVIEVVVDADGTFTRPAGLKAKYTLTTTIFLGLETGRPHALDGAGTIGLEGTVDQDGQAVRVEGTFKITMKGRNEFK